MQDMAEKLQFLTEILYFKQCLSASILILVYAGPQFHLVLYIFTAAAKINIATNFSSLFFLHHMLKECTKIFLLMLFQQ